jgi:ABC-type nitrate/sulfonate/bicarbonate transport system substrate-binding protein
VLRSAAGLAKNVAYYVGRRPFTDRHPEIVTAFLAQVSLAGKWARENAAAVAELLAPELSLPRGVLALAFRSGATPVRRDPGGVLDALLADVLNRRNARRNS